jgi:hypothetical protein
MQSSVVRRTGLVFAVAIGPLLLSAQTLQQRPETQPPAAQAQAATSENSELPKGTSLQVGSVRNYPVKLGERVEARLLHPLYADGKLVVPQSTVLHGKVVALEPDAKARLHARLRGDLTPFHTATVRFDEVTLPTGPVRIDAAAATGGAPVVHLTAPGVAPKQSFVAREWAQAKSTLHARMEYFTAPGKGDRALQFVYHQLPYHPERIEANTAWSFELTAPVNVPAQDLVAETSRQAVAGANKPEVWSVHALLENGLTSATARAGDSVQALVVEPVYDKDNQLVVPQGATLVGKVTTATAARSFGRNGKLRFTFQQIRFPEGSNKSVAGSLAGAATEKTQNLSLDAEGTISPKNQASVIAPLLLTALAGRALDQDGNMTVDNGVASNGFGLVGRIVGLTASNRNLAAGLGYYAASLSLYENFLRSGRDVIFPRDTRIEIETTPLRAPVLAPNGR